MNYELGIKIASLSEVGSFALLIVGAFHCQTLSL